MIVVDMSIIASLWVPNDMEELVYEVLRKDLDWTAPLLWRSELWNELVLYLRKNILELSTVLQSVQQSSFSSYDCEFVALADDLDIQLESFDKQICREFSGIAVHPKMFVN